MRSDLKNSRVHLSKWFLIWVGTCLLLSLPATVFSQQEPPGRAQILVGVADAPPVYFKGDDGRWEGLGIEIWQAVARDLEASFEIRQFDEFGALLEAIKNEEIDAIPCLPAELRHELEMDLSQSYYKSGLAIAVPMVDEGSKWWRIVAKIFSKEVLGAVGLLFLSCLAAGLVVSFFERPRKDELYGEGAIKGLGHGLWWSFVTMTTVGYGDKTPRTTGGRTVAVAWMLLSVVFLASFTAHITSSLTVGELKGKVQGFDDLHRARVGSISTSEAAEYLAGHGIAAMPFQRAQEGLKALADKKIDAFVLNKLVLQHLAKTEFPGQVRVLPGVFDEYFVAVALKNNSPLREPVNQALLKLMKTEGWRKMFNRYVSSGNGND